MRVIFLDIDGVLNTQSSRTATQREGIDRDCLRCLHELVQDTGATVVITSVWRKFHTVEALKVTLQLAVTPDATPRLGPRRGQEIRAWLELHPDVTQFVILDDESKTLLYDQLGRLVKTSDTYGLTPQLAQRAHQLLLA